MAFRTAGGGDYSSSLSHHHHRYEDCDLYERDDRRRLATYPGAVDDRAPDPRGSNFSLPPDPYCVSPFRGSPEPAEPAAAWVIAKPQPLPPYFIIREDSPSPPPALARSISQPPLRPRYPDASALRSRTPGPPPYPSRTATSTPHGASARLHFRPAAHDDAPFQGPFQGSPFPFLKIKEHTPPLQDDEALLKGGGYALPPPPAAASSRSSSPEPDLREADVVRDHLANFQRRCPDSKHERILLSIIHPKSSGADFPLDEEALLSIFSVLNEMFFGGQLTNRVVWKWSDETSNPDYANRIAGYTSLRPGPQGYEPSITLSTPILRDPKYNRRLLISAFIHELIHCYLFIRLGFAAFDKGCNGHTEDFKAITRIVDEWAGERNNLYLCEMEADLDNFRQQQQGPAGAGRHEIREHDHHGATAADDSGYEEDGDHSTYRHDFCCPAVVSAQWEQQRDRWDNPLELARGSDGRGGSPYVY